MIDVTALVRKAAAAALNAQAEVAQKATRELAPKDTAALVESIKVTRARASDLVSQLYSNSEYAGYQHEQLDLVHSNGQAKFMEAGVLAEQAAIQSAGVAAARAALS